MMEKTNFSYIKDIKNFLKHYIIPIKEVNENLIKGKRNEDILLIMEIIAQDYTNFFHMENIRRISSYINKF